MYGVSNNSTLVKTMTNNVLSAVQLFGFDIEYNESQFKVVLNQQTFLKPNPKAFEVIVHFLLTQLDGDRAQKAFSQCWPPILKEQTKEFKDTMYHWLVEITSPNKQPKENVASKFQGMLHHIKFPSITKSLFMTPGGLKICELLFALSQYVTLFRLLKMVDSNKLNKRVWPKVSPFLTPLNVALGNNTHELNKQSTSGAKILSQKQLAQFEIQRNSLKHKVDYELSEFDHLLTNLINVRTQWESFTQEKISNIRTLIEKKAQSSQSSLRKIAKLAHKLNLNGDGCNLEQICTQFNDSKLINFETEWAKLMEIKKNSIEDEEMKDEIKRLTNGETEKLELNGNKFIHGGETDCETNVEMNKCILQYVYENIDQNPALRNTKVGDLFYNNGTKLDLVNLIRLNSLVLILKGENYSKLDQVKLNNLTSMMRANTGVVSNQLFSTGSCDLPDATSKFGNLLTSMASINEKAADLKAKLDVYLPKLEEKCKQLLDEKAKGLNELSDAKNENSANKLLSDYFGSRKEGMKEKCMKYKDKVKFNKNAELARSVTNTPGQADANNCTNQLEFTCIPNDNSPQLDFTNINHSKSDQSHRLSFHSGNSFQLLDLAEESNMELI